MIAVTAYEVIVPFATWRQGLLPLLADRTRVATGPLLRDPGRQPTGLLVEELTVHASPRTGADFAPLADWIAVAAPAEDTAVDPETWLRRLQPRFAQMLVILLVGFGPARRSWSAWTVDRGVLCPLAGLRIIGPGMVHVAKTPVPDFRGDSDAQRWSRLEGAVGPGTFAKLRTARVAVIGCSRTGSSAAAMFAALEVCGLVLIDGDHIEAPNLDGLLLATEADIGANKAVALGRRLVAFRSDLLVKALPRPLDSRAAEAALGGVDLVVSCVDQDGARLRAAHWAREHLAPHLDIGAGVTRLAGGERQLAADVRLLLPGAGCIRCVGGLADLDQAEYELFAPPGSLPRRPPEDWNARGRLGSLPTLNAVAAATGVQLWLDLLDGTLRGSTWHRLRWMPGAGWERASALVGADPDCPVCRRPGRGAA
jgi:molybdopterin/thiamine biosynthesis adenylyltransferase